MTWHRGTATPHSLGSSGQNRDARSHYVLRETGLVWFSTDTTQTALLRAARAYLSRDTTVCAVQFPASRPPCAAAASRVCWMRILRSVGEAVMKMSRYASMNVRPAAVNAMRRGGGACGAAASARASRPAPMVRRLRRDEPHLHEVLARLACLREARRRRRHLEEARAAGLQLVRQAPHDLERDNRRHRLRGRSQGRGLPQGF